MNDDRSGIDRLRSAVEEVAAALGPPAARRVRARLGRRAAAVTGLALAVAAGWWIARGPVSQDVTRPGRLGIEVKRLRLGGRDVDPRVFDAVGAGTIVVAPRPRSRTETGPAILLLHRGG